MDRNMKKLNFITYLVEFDRSDIELQQQHGGMQAPAQRQPRKSDFQQKMAASPEEGNVVLIKSNRFLVQGVSREGVVLKQIGGEKTGTIPHTTKFEKIGDTKTGKPIFKAILQ